MNTEEQVVSTAPAEQTSEAVVDDTPATEVTETTPPAEDTPATSTPDTVPEQTGTETVPTEDGAPTEDSAAPPEEVVFTPVYKGQVVPIAASDRQEIETLLQLGMKQREVLPTWERLRQMAHESGMQSVEALVQSLVDNREQRLLEQAISDYGEEKGKRFYEYDKAQREQAFTRHQEEAKNADAAETKALNERLADQFLELQKEYPELTSFSEIPKTVVQTAIEKGIPLLDAMGRYERAEAKKSAAAQAAAATSAKASAGSMQSTEDTGVSAVTNAFKRGFYARV